MNWDKLAEQSSLDRAAAGVKGRNIDVIIVNGKKEALDAIKGMIPKGSTVMSGGSTTLDQIGFTDMLRAKNHEWENLKDEILAEKDPKRQAELRAKSITAKYYLGSVHAVTEDGELIVASATGSQIPAYSHTADNLILVVGTQKIVKNHEDGIKRLKEYVLPLEDKRMKALGYPGSTIAKILIIEREIMPNRKVTVIFVKEKLGF